jgi:transposase
MSKRYGLSDEQWEKIEKLLPGREGTVGVPAKANRVFVEAVIYRYRSGIPWRDLPERFGDFRVVHTRFSRWAKTCPRENGERDLGRNLQGFECRCRQ